MVPNGAWPSDPGAATSGTRTSLMIQPSYHPDSLLMTMSPHTSVKMSMSERGSAGSTTSESGLSSSTARTEPMASLAGSLHWSLNPATGEVNASDNPASLTR